MSERHSTVLVCRVCSFLEPINTPHGEEGCMSRDWIYLPLVEDLSVFSSVVMPHPDGGWPEVRVTRVWLVRSSDPAKVEAARRLLADEAAEGMV